VGLFIIQKASLLHISMMPCAEFWGAHRPEIQKVPIVRFLPNSPVFMMLGLPE